LWRSRLLVVIAGSMLLFIESSKRLSAPLMSILEQVEDELFQGVTVSDDPWNTSSTYASLASSVWDDNSDSPSTFHHEVVVFEGNKCKALGDDVA
jgi:hypothetical protein